MAVRVPTKDFPKDKKTLILQIRWLLNEMDYSISLIEEGNNEEALKVLRKEVDDNIWLTFNDFKDQII